MGPDEEEEEEEERGPTQSTEEEEEMEAEGDGELHWLGPGQSRLKCLCLSNLSVTVSHFVGVSGTLEPLAFIPAQFMILLPARVLFITSQGCIKRVSYFLLVSNN